MELVPAQGMWYMYMWPVAHRVRDLYYILRIMQYYILCIMIRQVQQEEGEANLHRVINDFD